LAGVTISVLKRRKDFLAAASSGFKLAKPALVVQSRMRTDAEISPTAIRIGFTATKMLGNAVVRNRVKRRLRAAAIQLVPTHGIAGCDYVFIGRQGAYRGAFDDLIRDMKHALKRLADQMAQASGRLTQPPKEHPEL
jgi:ribonuclease P protein component